MNIKNINYNPISLAKGLAIISMVAGHSWIGSPIEGGVNLYDMTLFFFVSGYCFNDYYLDNFKLYLLKRIKGLWIPYVKWSIISILTFNLFISLSIYTLDNSGAQINPISLLEIFKRILSVFFGGAGYAQFLGGYWFLKVMFFSALISWFICKIFRAHLLISGLGVLMLGTSLFFVNQYTPYCLSCIFMSSFSFVIGRDTKDLMDNSIIFKNLYRYIFINIFFFVIIFLFSYNYLHSSMASICSNNTIWWMIPAFGFTSTLLSFLLFNICLYFDKSDIMLIRMIEYIGNKTLVILTLHMLSFKILNFALVYTFNLNPIHTGAYPTILFMSSNGWWILYILVGVAVPLLADFFFTRIKLIIKSYF